MKYAIVLPLLLSLCACDRNSSLVSLGLSARSIPPSDKVVVVMGQSNAVRFVQNGGPHALAVELQSFAPGALSFIDCAVGGTALETWMPRTPNYQNCLDRLDGRVPDLILFQQGEYEAEAADTVAAQSWGYRFQTMMNQFRHDINNPRAVVLYTRLGDVQGCPLTNQVRASQESVSLQNARMVNLDGIYVPIGLHYEPESYSQIAHRYALAYRQLLFGE